MFGRTIWLLIAALAGVAAAGCTPDGALPTAPVKHDLGAVVASGPDVYGWHAQTGELATYWGRHRLTLTCSGRFPAGWKAPGDETWQVKAVNDQGTRVPFMGVVRRYLDIDGKEQVECLPACDFRKLPDGMYLFIETAVKPGSDGAPAEIRPNAFLMEIRRGGFSPFQNRIALVPDRESPLTPRPEVGPPPHVAVDAKNNDPKGSPLPNWF
ncbi:MAG TPA: hypothetical protein PK280_09710 [Planctomycetota bacterium]|nr:hypothetical protein [Planctomycetota bacterium]